MIIDYIPSLYINWWHLEGHLSAVLAGAIVSGPLPRQDLLCGVVLKATRVQKKYYTDTNTVIMPLSENDFLSDAISVSSGLCWLWQVFFVKAACILLFVCLWLSVSVQLIVWKHSFPIVTCCVHET